MNDDRFVHLKQNLCLKLHETERRWNAASPAECVIILCIIFDSIDCTIHLWDVCSRRPDSADSFLSPSRSGSHNGEKDWENASTTSSVTSMTEYTG